FLLHRFHGDVFVDYHDHLLAQALAEMSHEGMMERRLILIARQAEEVLEIRLLHNRLNGFSVRQWESFLNDQGSHALSGFRRPRKGKKKSPGNNNWFSSSS